MLRLPSQLRWLRDLRERCASDLVLDFQGLLRSAIVGRACRAPGGVFLGLSDSREGARFFYDRTIKVLRDHAVDRYLRVPEALGIERGAAPEWRLPPGTRPDGFTMDEPFCLLHPFARGAGKSLSCGDVEAFCKALPFPVVLAGRGEALLNPPENTFSLLNRTSLGELIWLIRRARFTVSVDSGPMHIAAAIGPRVLGIHTWSDPALVGPYAPEAWVWKDRTLFPVKALRQPAARRLAAPDIETVAAFVAEQMRASG